MNDSAEQDLEYAKSLQTVNNSLLSLNQKHNDLEISKQAEIASLAMQL